jgi:hypothetical protein
MSVIRDIKDDIPWWGVLCGIVGSALWCWLFDHFGRFDLALPTINGIGVFGFVLVLKWQLRQRVWFWITMTIVVALHVLLILSIPWTTKWVPAPAYAGAASLDLTAILVILSVVRKFAEESKLKVASGSRAHS